MPLEEESILIQMVQRNFFRVLSKINMPRALVENEDRRKHVEVDSSPGKDVTDGSPQVQSPSKYFQTPMKRHEERKNLPLRDDGLIISIRDKQQAM